MPSQLDNEKAEGNILTVLDRIKTDTDIVTLSEYRKIFKKNVSFFKRSWAAAWLLKYYDQKETPAQDIYDSSAKRPARERTKREQYLNDDNSKRIFISAGRKKRFFPREALSLIYSKTNVSREDIGLIKIFDNYTFVQVTNDKAQEVIDALNGVVYKGKPLTVNYAKPKQEEEA